MSKYPWTELTQAKWQTRRMLGDLGHDVESLVFSIADLDYNRWDGYRLGDMDRYGLVKTDKQYRLLKVKMAYYAVQNVVAVFDDTLERVPDYPCEVQCPKATACYAYKNKQSGQQVLVFWDKSGVPSDRNDTVAATFTIAKGAFTEPVWVDLITGGIHAIPAEKIVRDGEKVIFKDIPVYDAPDAHRRQEPSPAIAEPPRRRCPVSRAGRVWITASDHGSADDSQDGPSDSVETHGVPR